MEFKFKSIALGTYEIDVPNNEAIYEMLQVEGYDYVDTSICYNNDYELNRLLSENPSVKVISKIPPQMINQYEFMVSHHLEELGRDKIDVMLIHNPRADWSELAKKLESDKRFLEVGVSNFSIMQLNEYMKVIGHYPKYNEIEVNPDYYDKDLIEFCHQKGIKVVAYAILGGKYNARRNISRFTLTYLLAFAAKNADIVILRSDSSYRLNKSIRMLKSLDKVLADSDHKLLDRPASTNKSIVPNTYTLPEIYLINKKLPGNGTNVSLVTGCDKISDIGNLEFVESVDPDEVNSYDELNIIDYQIDKMGDLPSYEFVSDYRVLFRYLLKDLMIDRGYKFSKERKLSYLSPGIYIEVFEDPKDKNSKGTAVLMSVNLINKDNTPTKVNSGDQRIVITTEYCTL